MEYALFRMLSGRGYWLSARDEATGQYHATPVVLLADAATWAAWLEVA